MCRVRGFRKGIWKMHPGSSTSTSENERGRVKLVEGVARGWRVECRMALCKGDGRIDCKTTKSNHSWWLTIFFMREFSRLVPSHRFPLPLDHFLKIHVSIHPSSECLCQWRSYLRTVQKVI